jgi:hypothetical protein
MYFSYLNRGGGHDAMGIAQPSDRWLFAEGYTGGDFDTYLLLQNPGSTPAPTTLTYMKSDGGVVEQEIVIEPHSRFTVHVDELPGLEQAEFSTLVQSETPLVAERAMYFSYKIREGGSCSQGTTSPSDSWFFAEGYTGS